MNYKAAPNSLRASLRGNFTEPKGVLGKRCMVRCGTSGLRRSLQNQSGYLLIALAVSSVLTPKSHAQIIYTSISGANYTQNFDNLFGVVPGNNTTTVASTLPTGWLFTEAGANANTALRVDNGSSGSGDTYLDGTTGSNERAFGSFASGSLISIFGAQVTNNTGLTLNSFTLTYDGEQWKDGGSSLAVLNTLAFSYSVGATSLTVGTYTNATGLNFTAKVNNTTADATLDGNLAANRTAGITLTISGLTWSNGTSLFIRWSDINDAGNDDNLAIDNVVFSALHTAAPANVTWNTTTGAWNATSTNWLGGDPVSTLYKDGDTPAFGNIAIDSTVTVQAGGVSPANTVISNAANKYTFAGGAIGGSGSVTKSGAGTAALTVANSYSNGTNLNSGILIVDGGDNRLGGSSGALTFAGGTLRTDTSGITSARNIVVNPGGGNFDTNGLDSTTSGTSTMNDTFTKSGAGDISLNGAVTFGTSGSLSIGAGSLSFGQTSGTINMNNGGTFTGDLVVKNAIRVNFNSGTFGAAGSVKINTTGTTISDTNSTASALTAVINSNIVLNATNAAGTFITNIGATQAAGSGSQQANILEINGVISGSSDVTFASAGGSGGAGIVQLDKVNTYTGSTLINNANHGVVRLNVADALPTATALTFGSGLQATGTLDLHGFDQHVASLASGTSGTQKGIANTGAGPVTIFITGGATTTFSGIIGVQVDDATNPRLTGQSNNLALTLTEAHTGSIKLTGANTFTGATTISSGTLEAGATNALGGTNNIAINGGTLLLSGAGTDRINNSAAITMGGGKIGFTGDVTEGSSPGTGALTLTANSIIDFGGGNDIINFGASGGVGWTGGATLSIYNWSGLTGGGGSDQLKFGSDSNVGLLGSLTSSQLGQISFFSGVGTGFLGNGSFSGSLGEVVPVPEPSAIAVAMGLLGLIGFRERRKGADARQMSRRVMA